MPHPTTILLVDDDVDFVEMNRQVLESAGYVVVCAHDTRQALAALADRPADLVVTDLMMGALNSGFTLAARIKGDPKLAHIPVIIATSVARQSGYDFRPRSADELAKMQVDAYLDKPVRAKALLAKVAELLKTKPT